MPIFDFLIVGAGFAGLVSAERLCNKYGKKCLVIDKRPHIGGNAYDCEDKHGVLIHPYGPHYFRTNSKEILNYLSRFTEWIPGNYKVKTYSQGRHWSFPINLETFEQYVGTPSTTAEMQDWLESVRIDFENITNSEEAILSKVGHEWFNMFFKGYTLKQWNRHPRELSASVCNRIPVRTIRDDRYFNDEYQVLPSKGYHTLFENIVRSCGDRLELHLEQDYKCLTRTNRPTWKHMIFTGPIDSFFEFKFGKLPYRSLRFEHEHYNADQIREQNPNAKEPAEELKLQPCVQVNYPGDEAYTRTVETKHITGQQIPGTTIVREFPQSYDARNEPFYPVPTDDSNKLYTRYKQAGSSLSDVSFLGRLGTYKYYNMDQVVGATLHFVDKFMKDRLAFQV